jgi:hypothetical protein
MTDPNSEHDPQNGQPDPDPEWVKRAEELILDQLAREFSGYRFFYELPNGECWTAEGRRVPDKTKLIRTIIVVRLRGEPASLDPDCEQPVFLHGVWLSPERSDRLIKLALAASGGLRLPESEDSFGSPVQPQPSRHAHKSPPSRPGLRGDGLLDPRLWERR